MGMREDDFLARMRARGIQVGPDPESQASDFRSRMRSRGLIIGPEPQPLQRRMLTPEQRDELFNRERPGFVGRAFSRIVDNMTGAWRRIMGDPTVETPAEVAADPEVQQFVREQQAAEAIAARNPLIEGAPLPSATPKPSFLEATGFVENQPLLAQLQEPPEATPEDLVAQPDVQALPQEGLTGAEVSIVPGVEPTPEVAGLTLEEAAVPPEVREQAAAIEARAQAALQAQGLPVRAVGAVARGVRDAPGVFGAAVRAAGPEDVPAIDRLIEEGLAQPSGTERGVAIASTLAPIFADIAVTRGAARIMAPKVGGNAGKLLAILGKGGSGTRASGAAAGAAETIPTNLADALERGEPGAALGFTALDAAFGYLFPGGGKVAEEFVELAKSNPNQAASAAVELAQQNGRGQYLADQMAIAARENPELEPVWRQIDEQARAPSATPEPTPRVEEPAPVRTPEEPTPSPVQEEIARRRQVREAEAARVAEIEAQNAEAAARRAAQTEEELAAAESVRESEAVRTMSEQRELDLGLQPVREPLPVEVPRDRRRTARRMRALRAENRQLATDPMSGLVSGPAAARAVENIDANPAKSFLGYDIANFKAVNDQLSPEVGDQVIGLAGAALRQAGEEFGIATRDMLRRGGDEFGHVVDEAMPEARRQEIMARTREIFQESLPEEVRAVGPDLRFGSGQTWSAAQESAAKLIGKTAREAPEVVTPAPTRGAGAAEEVANIITNWGRKGAQRAREAADDVTLNPNVAKAIVPPALAVGAAALPAQEGTDPMDRALLGLTAGAVLAMGPRMARAMYDKSPRFRKWFTPGGEVPGSARAISSELSRALQHAMPRSQGFAASHRARAQRVITDLNDAAGQVYQNRGRLRSRLRLATRGEPSVFKQIPEPDQRAISAFMEGDVTAIGRLPEPMRAPVRAMRAHIDEMSRHMIDNDIVAGELAVRFDENLGAYLTRAYRVFEDPKWAQTAPKALGEAEWERRKNQFKRWYRNQVFNATDDEMESIMAEFLARGDAENPLRFIKNSGSSKLKNAILKKRKDIPMEIRELWGEIDDPVEQFAKTIANQASYIGTYEFLRGLAIGGEQAGLLFRPQFDSAGNIINRAGLNPEFTHEFTSESLRPLQGLRTHPEFGKALERAWSVGREKQPNPIVRMFMGLNLLSKAAKTVGSQVAQLRNPASNVFMLMRDGHLFHLPTLTKGGWDATVGQVADALGFSGKRAPYRKAMFDKLKAAGVLADNARAGELQRVWNRFSGNSLQRFFDNGLGLAMSLPVRAAQGFYRAGDDVPKVMAHGVEMLRFRKAFPNATEDEIFNMAAARVRELMPTLSMTPESTKAISQVGGFVSWTSEMYRTTSNFFRVVQEELADPATRAIGFERLAGAVMAVGATSGLAQYSKVRNHVSPEEEEATRILSAPWNANSELVFTGPVGDGAAQFVDASYTNPYSLFAKPLVAFFRDQDPQQVVRMTAWEIIEPWISGSPLASELWEALADSGGEVEARDIMAAIMDGLEPSIVEQYLRAATEETSAGHPLDRKQEFLNLFTGTRQTQVDARTQLGFALNDWKDRLGKATSALRRAVNDRQGRPARRDPGITAEHLEEYTRNKVIELHQELAEQAWAAQVMGVPRAEVLNMMKDRRLSEDDRRNVMEMSDSFGAWMSSGGAKRRNQGRNQAMMGTDRSMDLAGWGYGGNQYLGAAGSLALAGAVLVRPGRVPRYSQRVASLAQRVTERYGQEGALDMIDKILKTRLDEFRMSDPRAIARAEVAQDVSDALRDIRQRESGRTVPVFHGTRHKFNAPRTIGSPTFGFHMGLGGMIDMDDVREMIVEGKYQTGTVLNMFEQLWDHSPKRTTEMFRGMGTGHGRDLATLFNETAKFDRLGSGEAFDMVDKLLFELGPEDVVATMVSHFDPGEIVALEFIPRGGGGEMIEGWARLENPLEVSYDFGGASARAEIDKLAENGLISNETAVDFFEGVRNDVMGIFPEMDFEDNFSDMWAAMDDHIDKLGDNAMDRLSEGVLDVVNRHMDPAEADILMQDMLTDQPFMLKFRVEQLVTQLNLRRVLENEGYDGIVYVNGVEFPGNKSVILFRPEQVRSRNARFDPRDAMSPDLMASLTGGLLAGAAATQGATGGVVEESR